jgi:hypothetical protein
MPVSFSVVSSLQRALDAVAGQYRACHMSPCTSLCACCSSTSSAFLCCSQGPCSPAMPSCPPFLSAPTRAGTCLQLGCVSLEAQDFGEITARAVMTRQVEIIQLVYVKHSVSAEPVLVLVLPVGILVVAGVVWIWIPWNTRSNLSHFIILNNITLDEV